MTVNSKAHQLSHINDIPACKVWQLLLLQLQQFLKEYKHLRYDAEFNEYLLRSIVIADKSKPEGAHKHQKVRPENDFEVSDWLCELEINDLGDGVHSVKFLVKSAQDKLRNEFVIDCGVFGLS